MEWYFIIIIIVCVVILLTILISYLCFLQAFYVKRKPLKNNEEINLPDNAMFKEHKDLIIKDIENARKMDFKEFVVQSFDGLTLYGKYFENFKDAPLEIMFHGYKGSGERDLSTGIRRAKECGRNCLIVDQRSHGKSDGHVITFGIKERFDCLTWINFAIDFFGKDIKIILTGISMGAATVMMVSNMDLPNNVVGILADCGYDSPKNIIKKYIKDMHLPSSICYPFVKLGAKIFGKVNIEETSPLECVSDAKVPIIFIHGDQDSFVPCDMSKALFNKCSSKKELVIIKNAEHGISYLVDPENYVDSLNKFF